MNFGPSQVNAWHGFIESKTVWPPTTGTIQLALGSADVSPAENISMRALT
jgi:hypothetical protein